MSGQNIDRVFNVDYNGPDLQLHHHVVGKNLDEFATELQGK